MLQDVAHFRVNVVRSSCVGELEQHEENPVSVLHLKVCSQKIEDAAIMILYSVCFCFRVTEDMTTSDPKRYTTRNGIIKRECLKAKTVMF